MAQAQPSKTLVAGFTSEFQWRYGPGTWKNSKQGSWKLNDDGSLTVCPDSERDYWRKTFYEPVLVKDDGPCYLVNLDSKSDFTVQVSMVMDAKKQFDQGGIFFRINEEYWVKAGLEFVDEVSRLSCVVTNQYSDWSTQNYPNEAIHLRLSKKGNAIAMEALPGYEDAKKSTKWEFVRISYFNIEPDSEKYEISNKIQVGVFACCPTEAGANVKFWDLSIVEGCQFHHTAY